MRPSVAIVSHILLFHTQFGTHLFAIGGNHEGSRNLGLKVGRVKIAAFAISGLLAGIARRHADRPHRLGRARYRKLLSPRIRSPRRCSAAPACSAAAALSLGPVVGALVLTALLNLMTLLGVGVFYQPIVTGSVVIIFAIAYRFQK